MKMKKKKKKKKNPHWWLSNIGAGNIDQLSSMMPCCFTRPQGVKICTNGLFYNKVQNNSMLYTALPILWQVIDQTWNTQKTHWFCPSELAISGLILGLRPANERRRYKVTPSLIGWAQTWNQPCTWCHCLLWISLKDNVHVIVRPHYLISY